MPSVAFAKQFAGTRVEVVEQKMDETLTALRGKGSPAAQKQRREVQDVFGQVSAADKDNNKVLSEKELETLKPAARAFVKSAVATMIELRTTRASGVPKAWELVKDPSRELKRIDRDGDGLTLRLKSGRTLDVDVNDVNRELLPRLFDQGYLQLYRNPHDDFQLDDDSGRKLWSEGFYLVPTAKFAMLDAQIETRAKKADSITKAISSTLDDLDSKMHASQVNSFATSQPTFDLQKLKDTVAAAIPGAKDAIFKYEADVAKWKGNNQLLEYPEGGISAQELATFQLDKVAPTITSISMRDLGFVKDLIRASELLMKRPEVQAVDPGDGIRVQVDTDTLVANGGNFEAMQAEVAKTMHDALITEPLQIERNNNMDKVIAAAQKMLGDKVGAANVLDQLGSSEGSGPHGYTKTVTLYVKKDVLVAARQQLDALTALFRPHGYDAEHFTLKIDAGN